MTSLRALVSFALDCARRCGFPDDRLNDIEIAAEEIFVNIINYAYPRGEGLIELTCSGADDRLILEIRDSGVSFNMLTKEDPDLTLGIEERQIGGLGIYFVKRLMDEVHYRREGDQNVLTIVVTGHRKDTHDGS